MVNYIMHLDYKCGICKGIYPLEFDAKECETQGEAPEILHKGTVFIEENVFVDKVKTFSDKDHYKDQFYILGDRERITQRDHLNCYKAIRVFYGSHDEGFTFMDYPKLIVCENNSSLKNPWGGKKYRTRRLEHLELENLCSNNQRFEGFLSLVEAVKDYTGNQNKLFRSWDKIRHSSQT